MTCAWTGCELSNEISLLRSPLARHEVELTA